MPNGPGTYGPGLLGQLQAGQAASPLAGAFPQKGGPFFASAAEGLLKQDTPRAEDMLGELQALVKRRQAFERVLKVAAKMGEDVSSLTPMIKDFDEQQAQLVKMIGGKGLLPSSATQIPAPQIPQPTLPNR